MKKLLGLRLNHCGSPRNKIRTRNFRPALDSFDSPEEGEGTKRSGEIFRKRFRGTYIYIYIRDLSNF